LLRPELATLAAVFLLYTNIPVLATRYGLPKAAAAASMLLLAVPLLHHVIGRREALRIDRTFRLMLVYLAILLVSSLGVRAPGVAAGYIGTFLMEGLALYLLIVNVVRSVSALRRVIWVLLLAGSLLGALTIYQEATGSFHQQFGGLAFRNDASLTLQQAAADPEAVEDMRSVAPTKNPRAGGPVGETNRFAQILLVLLPLGVWLYRTAPTRLLQSCAAAAGLLMLGGIIFSDSRGAFVALILTATVAVRMKWFSLRNVLTSAIALVLVVPLVAPHYVERVVSIATAVDLARDVNSANEVDGATRGRVTEMLAAWQAFLDHPVLGVGPGQYFPVYSVQYQNKDVRLKFRDLQTPRRAHSLYLEMAADVGIVGTAVFLLMFMGLMRALLHASRQVAAGTSDAADLAAALFLSLVAYAGTALFLHLAYVRYFWLLIALSSAALHAMSSRRPPVPAPVPTGTGTSSPRRRYGPASGRQGS